MHVITGNGPFFHNEFAVVQVVDDYQYYYAIAVSEFIKIGKAAEEFFDDPNLLLQRILESFL